MKILKKFLGLKIAEAYFGLYRASMIGLFFEVTIFTKRATLMFEKGPK